MPILQNPRVTVRNQREEICRSVENLNNEITALMPSKELHVWHFIITKFPFPTQNFLFFPTVTVFDSHLEFC